MNHLKATCTDFLNQLRARAVLDNPRGHNAAAVLASSDFAKQLTNQDFTSELVRLLSASESIGEFHLLCAIVDNVAPALGESTPLPGISVLRGELDTILPQLWQSDSPRELSEDDSLAALIFEVGSSQLTLPLARTTFLNNKTSTLLVGRHDLSQGSCRLVEKAEKQWQNICVAVDHPVQTIADIGLWAPLSPVTRARRITESFGNIVRGIDIEGESTPASTELEEAVNVMLERLPASEDGSRPMGVWALITPEHASGHSWNPAVAPDPAEVLSGRVLDRKEVEANASYLQQQYQTGSRFYQVLSGGGGWGAKKGLLSLDPRESYFAPSEEEELERFMQTMSKSAFAPPGAYIQFFVPARVPSELTTSSSTGAVFGVDSSRDSPVAITGASRNYLIANHFGALSSQGVYLSARLDEASQSRHDSKLSVPGSRLFISRSGVKAGGLLGFLGGGGLADAGTLAMM